MYWNVGFTRAEVVYGHLAVIISFNVAVGKPQRHSGGIDFLHNTKTPQPEVATLDLVCIGHGLILAVEDGVAERVPALTQTGLEVPGILFGHAADRH